MNSDQALRILHLQHNASLDDIKKSYRNMAKKCHPDKFSDPTQKSEAETRIKEINEAYNLLKYAWERKSDYCEPVADISNVESIRFTSTARGCEFFYERAQQRGNSGQDLEALQDCTQAIRLNPDYLEAYQLRRFICLKLGYENRAKSDDKNIERIERLQQKYRQSTYDNDTGENNVSDSPKTSRPHHQPPVKSSQNYPKVETFDYSVDDYSTDSSDISDPKIFYKRAQRKLKLGREKEAIEDCHKAIHLNADYVEAYRLRRMIYLRLGQQVEAAIDMQEIHRLEEAKPFQPKKSEVSQVDSVQSEVKSSKDPDVFYAQAIQNFEQGQYPDAIKNCNRAIRLNPDYLEVYKLRRKICIILGHKDRAAFDTKQINRIESNLAQATNLNQEN